jgi:hypothetical protein
MECQQGYCCNAHSRFSWLLCSLSLQDAFHFLLSVSDPYLPHLVAVQQVLARSLSELHPNRCNWPVQQPSSCSCSCSSCYCGRSLLYHQISRPPQPQTLPAVSSLYYRFQLLLLHLTPRHLNSCCRTLAAATSSPFATFTLETPNWSSC